VRLSRGQQPLLLSRTTFPLSAWMSTPVPCPSPCTQDSPWTPRRALCLQVAEIKARLPADVREDLPALAEMQDTQDDPNRTPMDSPLHGTERGRVPSELTAEA
jgi:hypothetical protein